MAIVSQSFQGRRVYRPNGIALAGVAALVLAGLILGVTGASPASLSTCTSVAGLAAWVLGMAVFVSRPMTISVVDGALIASWRTTPIRPQEVRIGRWVVLSVNTPNGLVAHVRGPGGSLRIGVRAPVADGYVLDGPRAQFVDCYLPAGDFDVLVATLGVQRGPAPAGLILELAEHRGSFRSMMPWMVAMASACLAGLALLGLGVSQTVAVSVMVSILVGGMCVTMFESWRIRDPTYELRIGSEGLSFAAIHGPEVLRARWAEVRAVPSTYIIREGRGGGRRVAHPAIELQLGPGQTIVVGTRDRNQAWTHPMDRQRRGPRWLVGHTDWPPLVKALGGHGCIR